MWALHDEALRAGMLPTIPASVLAQAWRGGPQARLSPSDRADIQALAAAVATPIDIIDI